jgi:hypothetical protein
MQGHENEHDDDEAEAGVPFEDNYPNLDDEDDDDGNDEDDDEDDDYDHAPAA